MIMRAWDLPVANRKATLIKAWILGALYLAVMPSSEVNAQQKNLEEVKKKYSNEELIVLETAEHYTIRLNSDQLEVKSNEVDRILYLGEHAVQMGKYSFHHSGFHEVQNYQAYTATTANKRVKVTEFKTSNSSSNSIFYDDVKETQFSFPQITPGAVGNLETSFHHKNPFLLSPYYFSRGVPVVHAELSLRVEGNIDVKYKIRGIDTSMIQTSVEEKKGEKIYRFVVKDLPAAKRYPDAPGASWYAPHVVFYIAGYTKKSGEYVQGLSETKDLYKMNAGFLSGLDPSPSPLLKRTIDSLCVGLKTPEDKARKIFHWVQKNIKYIAFEDGMEGFIPRQANLVYDRRYGDCKDMSSILTVMLNAAGLKAYHTWIGTRSLSYNYAETPLPIVDNHMICTVDLDGKYVFLDATDPHCFFGFPTEGIQDKEAMVAISPGEYKILTVPTIKKSENTIADSTFLTLTGEGINGTIRRTATGYFAMRIRGSMQYITDKEKDKYLRNVLSRGNNKFHLGEHQWTDDSSANKIFQQANFELKDYAKSLAGEWYVNMNLRKFFEGEEIDYPKRKIPIELDFHHENKYTVSLDIPDGYEVSYIPASKKFENKVWGFTADYKVEGKKLYYTLQFYNQHLMIQPDQFKEWNEVLEHLYPIYRETVVLKKKTATPLP